MNSQEIKLTKAGATLPKKEVDEINIPNENTSTKSSIIDVSHETPNIWSKSFFNQHKENIPILTETIDDVIIKSIVPTKSIGEIPDFSTERILAKNYRALNLIEQSFHSDLTISFQQSINNKQWLSFWSLLNQIKHQDLFFSDYYLYWIMKVLSSNDENAYKTLTLPFIWKNICNLKNEQIFELVKPIFEVLYYSKSLSLLFYLTDSLITCGINLPQEWLTDLTKFDYVNKDSKGSSTFSELLARNSQNLQTK